MKFVFKLTFKKLKSNLQRNKKNLNKDMDTYFYEYYFSETAERLQLSLENFFDPLNNAKTHLKTLSHDYIKRLMSSQLFRDDFLDYLNSGQLQRDYKSLIPNKIFKILSRFDDMFGSNNKETDLYGIKEVQRYFRSNKQCKLPWTDKEILWSVENFKTLCASFQH